MTPVCSEEVFIELVKTLGPSKAARKLNVGVRKVTERRRRLERKYGIVINGPAANINNRIGGLVAERPQYPHRIQLRITDGVVMVGSDSHYWPDVISPAHRAFVKIAREFKPTVIIKNGDELDFPSISRFAPIAWEKRPGVQREIETTQERLSEIEDASKNSKLYWPLGNHDARFETRLATIAPEYAMVHGVHLKDHFPRWKPCWSVWINDDVVVKHRYKGGIHATRNNTLLSGKTIITGHLHSLQVRPHSDYNGTRWGVDCGTMADPYGPQFVDYTEDNPKDWRQGFIILTFHKGKLLWPEVVFVRNDNEIEFRGKVIPV